MKAKENPAPRGNADIRVIIKVHTEQTSGNQGRRKPGAGALARRGIAVASAVGETASVNRAALGAFPAVPACLGRAIE